VSTLLRSIARTVVLGVMPDSDRLRSLATRPKFETWRRQHGPDCPIFETRDEMFGHVMDLVGRDTAITYLEFGVFEGESIRTMAGLNGHRASSFVGFDTFSGLPEDWVEFNRIVERKTFDTGGATPQIDDDRVRFETGLFQDTLPGYLERHDAAPPLVIHNDSDLYSSTMYVLTAANQVVVPGTIVIFDEFYSVMHEFRALEDWCAAYRRSYEVVAATRNHGKIAIRIL
jgi:hypothetical protein